MSSRRPWLFFALTFGWSWILWLPAALSQESYQVFPNVLLLILGGFGPTGVALFLVYRDYTRPERRDFWRRVVDYRHITPIWYAVIFLLPLILYALAILTGMVLGAPPPERGEITTVLANPLLIVPTLLQYVILGPISEELGWRGYAQEYLQAGRWSALTASLVVGVIWALWHLPLFFIEGTDQDVIGFGSARFWPFMIYFLPWALLSTWIYNNTYRSILSAMLFHFSTNFLGLFIVLSSLTEAYRVVWGVIVAGAVVLIFGARTLRRAP